MMRVVDVPSWQVTLATIAAAGLSLTIAVATFLLPFRDRRARNFATAVVAIAIFAIYKEGVVRPDAGHLSLYFSSACILWIGLPWQRGRWLLAGALAIALVGIPMRPTGMPTNYHLFDNVKLAGEQVGNLFSPSKRADLIDTGRVGSKVTYRLEPKIKAALEGHTVSVEPWETNVAWVYELPWKPVPIFQNYSAYTSHLDRLNAEAIEAPDGPERILRENPPTVFAEFETPDLDGRFFGWDPPEQARAVLCHFAPLQVNLRWEVLGRTSDRCGAPRPVGSVAASYGQTVDIPAPGPGEVVFVRIHGAGVSGLEKLTNLLLHARTRHAILNETTSYRLIPETATDGLLMAGDPALVAEEGSFSPIPQAQTIKLEGASGDLTFDFFAMKVAPADVMGS